MDIDFLQSAATRSSGPRSESPPRGSENASAEPHQTYFVPRSEAPTNASPDQLLALLVALAAEINSSDSIRDSNALENVVNKDVGISNIHTAFVGNGSSFSVRAWRFDRPERSLVFKSAMPSDYKFTHREERRRLADIILELRALSHPALRGQKNVVELLGLGWETDSFEQARKWPVLILEYADGGTLTDVLHREHISLQAKLRICHDIACGLTALHEVGIIHGDVKPQNILMFQGPSSSNAVKSWVAKLGDFGGAIMDASDNDMDVLRTGTQPWNAPEWKAEMRAIDMKRTDIYSFGLVIWSIAADGVDPFTKSTEIFSLPPDIVDTRARYKAIEVLKRDGSGFLAKILDAGHSNFFSELNGRLVERLLTLTVQSEPTLRDLEKVTAIVAEETGRSTVAPVLKQWQRQPQGLEDMLVRIQSFYCFTY
jgi:serine/threonine protein kinase